jgi:hypothetical protein
VVVVVFLLCQLVFCPRRRRRRRRRLYQPDGDGGGSSPLQSFSFLSPCQSNLPPPPSFLPARQPAGLSDPKYDLTSAEEEDDDDICNPVAAGAHFGLGASRWVGSGAKCSWQRRLTPYSQGSPGPTVALKKPKEEEKSVLSSLTVAPPLYNLTVAREKVAGAPVVLFWQLCS